MVKPTITLDRKLFALARAVAIVHAVPLRDLIGETLLAAFLGKEAFHNDEQDVIALLARLYRLDLKRMARKLKGGILTRERRPKRRKRRAKKNPT